MSHPFVLACVGAVVALVSLAQAPRPSAAAATGPDLAQDIARIAADIDGYDRFYPIRWSDELLERQSAFLRTKLDDLRAAEFDKLAQPGRVDYLLMRDDIRAALTANRLHSGEYGNPVFGNAVERSETRFQG